MRILLIHQFFLEDGDGGGSRWNEMTRIWTELGHEITVIAGMTHYMETGKRQYKGKYFQIGINKDNVKVIRCFVAGRTGGFFSRIFSFLSFSFTSIFAGLKYAREDYEIIIVTSPPLFVGLSAIFLSWWKSTPFVFEVRDLWPESAIEMGILKNKMLIKVAYRFELYIYTKASFIAVLTPAFRDVLIKKGITSDRIIFIPNAADFKLSENLLSSFDVGSFRRDNGLGGKFVITYVGAHGIANHLIQILDAAVLFQDTNVHFLLIGNGEEKESLIREVNIRQISNVQFVNTIPKTEAFRYILASDMGISVLKKADIFKTIYSNKTFDYFSCKKPVLMAIDGISRQLVEGADAGIFVEPENPEDFALKIRYYLQNPELLKRQGENGYAYAKNHFDREVLAKQYLNYIRAFRNLI